VLILICEERHLRLFEALLVFFFSDLVKLTHALLRCFRSSRHEATILSMCFNLSRASRADNLVKLRKNFQLRAVSAEERSAALNAFQERNELQGSCRKRIVIVPFENRLCVARDGTILKMYRRQQS